MTPTDPEGVQCRQNLTECQSSYQTGETEKECPGGGKRYHKDHGARQVQPGGRFRLTGRIERLAGLGIKSHGG